MEILNSLKTILKINGILFTYSDSVWYKLLGYFGCFSVFALAYPMTIYVLSILHDIRKFAEVTPGFLGVVNAFFKSLMLLYYRSLVKYLLINLQRNVDTKISEGRSIKQYEIVNVAADRLARNYSFMLVGCLVAYIVGPAAVILVHYFTGTYTDELLRLPLDATYPYDYKQMPAYLYTYVSNTISIYFLTFSLASGDCFFMSMCQHIIGCLKDLMDMFTEIDSGLTSEHLLRYDQNNRQKIRLKIAKCVDFHNTIFEYIDVLEQVASPIISIQFLTTMTQLCTLAFDLTMNEPTLDRYLKELILASTCLSQLFIYCYFGNEITLMTDEMLQAIYNLKWYNQSPEIRKDLLMTMMRTKKQRLMKGFKMITCSLERFTAILNMVGSLFAILKSSVTK